MNTLWVYTEDSWKKANFVPERFRHETADYRNKKYGKRHYWVSNEKPGRDELEEIRLAKKQSDLEFVDVHEEGELA